MLKRHCFFPSKSTFTCRASLNSRPFSRMAWISGCDQPHLEDPNMKNCIEICSLGIFFCFIFFPRLILVEFSQFQRVKINDQFWVLPIDVVNKSGILVIFVIFLLCSSDLIGFVYKGASQLHLQALIPRQIVLINEKFAFSRATSPQSLVGLVHRQFVSLMPS